MTLLHLKYASFLFIVIFLIASFIMISLVTKPNDALNQREVKRWTPPPTQANTVVSNYDPITLSTSTASTKPLFRKSRQPFDPNAVNQAIVSEPVMEPPAPPPPPPPPPVDDLATLKIKGIFINNDQKMALFARDSVENWHGLGAEIEGWKITDIDASGATLKLSDKTKRFNLYVDNKANGLDQTKLPPY